MKKVKFWKRVKRERYDEWMLVEGGDESGVPLKAWKAFNKAFWKWKQKGLLWPMDEMDAYQFAAGEMVRAADRVSGGFIETALPTPSTYTLSRASLATYLVSAAYRSLMKYRERQVQPMREKNAALAKIVRSRKDEDDASDVRAFVEALPGVHSAERVQAMRLAAECVEATLARLDGDAQAGLRAWLGADGVWVDAAKMYNPCGSVQGYVYRFKHLWAPAFRKACVWVW